MENQKWEKALISLTPGGSEFCDDPEYCVKYIKEFQAFTHKMLIDNIIEQKSNNHVKITKSEADFICQALNAYFHDANDKLSKSSDLGDYEIINYKHQLNRSKEILERLNHL